MIFLIIFQRKRNHAKRNALNYRLVVFRKLNKVVEKFNNCCSFITIMFIFIKEKYALE